MGTQIVFENIYQQTYRNTFKYVVLHCQNLDDVNDIVQDTYVELYKDLRRKKQKKIMDINSYIIGITKNIIKKYYRFKYKNSNVCSFNNEENEELMVNTNEDLDLKVITNENVEEIWKYVQSKNVKIAKIFYLYYYMDMKISEIAKEMNLKESATKNYLYRTIKEVKLKFEKESSENVEKQNTDTIF